MVKETVEQLKYKKIEQILQCQQKARGNNQKAMNRLWNSQLLVAARSVLTSDVKMKSRMQ